MKYLLDTNICILLIDRPSTILAERARDCDEGDLVTSAIVFAELVWGSRNGKLPQIEVLTRFVRDVAVQPFDQSAADSYARLPFRRGSFDRLIAAHALALGVTLVTNNERDFADIPELKVENWTR